MSRSRDAASERSRPTPARRGEDGGIRLGAAYYPEQWPRERWPVDAELMAEAGLSLVRIGEFAWAQLEPAEGTFDFAWLDDGLEVFAAAGLSVVLGTPTAAPPAWLVERYPEILPRAPDGRVIGFGHRRHYCPNQPAFHDATERIVAALAERYGEDARVIAWQIDNELSGHCFCDRCHRAFHDWLESRYSSLDELNERWGTAFWSQTYSSWRQIPLPALGPVPLPHGFLAQSPNPGLALDFRRFSSESMIRYLELQARVLRSRCAPRQRITSNLMGFDFGEIDYHVLAEALDFVSWDNYPVLDREGRWSTAALSADAIRGLRDAPVWVLEQQVGPLGWEMLRTPRRGQLRLHAYQAIAHGAEAVVFFRWRTARFGTEQHWHGILDHDGRPRRRFRDVRCLAGELGRLEGSLAGAPRPADAAILDDYDSRFALQGQPTNPALRYEETIRRHYEGLRRLGLGVDLVSPAADLARYRLVVAAGLYVVGPALAARLASYVEAGGRLVLAPRSGVKDRWNAHPERPLPAWLDELTGLEISDYASLGDEARSAFAWENGGPPAGHFAGWWEELELKGARPIARYLDGEFAGTAAIAEREVGAGRVIYLAGAAEDSTLVELYRRLAAEAGLDVLELPDGVEAVRLGGTPNGLLFLLNHADDERIVELGAGRWRDLVAERDGEGVIELPPFGVALVSEPAPAALAPGRAEESVGADR